MYTAIFFVLLLMLFLAVVAITAYLLAGHGNYANTSTETYTSYSTPDFGNAAGFVITGAPDNEILTPREYRLVNGNTAEIIYNATPADTVHLRVAPAGTLKLPDDYKNSSYESVAEYPIDNINVTHSQSAGQRGLLQWTKDGYDYALFANEPEMNLLGGVIDDFVTSVNAKKTS